MTKVLHVLDHSLPEQSGYAFRSHAILRALGNRGYQVEAVTSPKQRAGGRLADEIDGVPYHRTSALGVATTGIGGQLRTIRLTRAKVASRLKSFPAQLIHAHSPCLNGLAALGHKRPLLYEMRSSWEDAAVSQGITVEGSLRYRASRALETYVVKRADAVAVICEGLRRELIGRGVVPERIAVVPNALPPEMFQVASAVDGARIRQRFGLDQERVIGFFGSFFEWEGIDTLILAIKQMLPLLPDVRLLLAGGGRQEDQLRQLARENGVANKVIFAGRVRHEEVPAFYAAVDVMVYPRVSDRLTEMVTPLKPLEAMAQRKLVVASNVGGHRELIEDGETGVLFPPGDQEALVRALLEALAAPVAMRVITTRARQTVERERQWSTVVDRYFPIYERLIVQGSDGNRRHAVARD